MTASRSSPTASNSTDSLGNFAVTIGSGVFTTNGLKTLEIYTTDDAGAVSNKVTRLVHAQCVGDLVAHESDGTHDTDVELGYQRPRDIRITSLPNSLVQPAPAR